MGRRGKAVAAKQALGQRDEAEQDERHKDGRVSAIGSKLQLLQRRGTRARSKNEEGSMSGWVVQSNQRSTAREANWGMRSNKVVVPQLVGRMLLIFLIGCKILLQKGAQT